MLIRVMAPQDSVLWAHLYLDRFMPDAQTLIQKKLVEAFPTYHVRPLIEGAYGPDGTRGLCVVPKANRGRVSWPTFRQKLNDVLDVATIRFRNDRGCRTSL